MAANQPDQPPSGPGQARRLAQQTAAGLAVGETVTMAVKTATLPQLTSIMAFGCARGGFPTFNRHLNQDQLHGLGWQELQPLLDNPAKAAEALQTSLDTLVSIPVCKACSNVAENACEPCLGPPHMFCSRFHGLIHINLVVVYRGTLAQRRTTRTIIRRSSKGH